MSSVGRTVLGSVMNAMIRISAERYGQHEGNTS